MRYHLFSCLAPRSFQDAPITSNLPPRPPPDVPKRFKRCLSYPSNLPRTSPGAPEKVKPCVTRPCSRCQVRRVLRASCHSASSRALDSVRLQRQLARWAPAQLTAQRTLAQPVVVRGRGQNLVTATNALFFLPQICVTENLPRPT